MNIKYKFSNALYYARTERQLTQEEASELLDISNRWFQKIEKGIAEPKLTLACKIAKEFSIDLNKLAEIDADDKISLERRLLTK